MPRRDPFQRMMDRMEDAFKSFQDIETTIHQQVSAHLPVDVTDTGDELIVTADLPGVEEEHIAVQTGDDRITLRAQDEQELEHEEHEYYRRERSARQYRREIALPARVNPDSASATYKNGVLTVRLKKVEDTDQQDVPINEP